jgi:hypothetical protein
LRIADFGLRIEEQAPPVPIRNPQSAIVPGAVMSNTARVDSIDSLKVFRVALIKFGEEANAALASAESEMQRMVGWLERDQQSFWQLQLRKRNEGLSRAQEALRMKKLFPDSSGRFPTPVEEEKAVRKWKAAVEEAEQKLAACRKYARILQKAIMDYKGGVQRLSTWVEAEVPNAVARLDRMVGKLEAYVALSAPAGYAPVREASLAAFTSGDAPAGGMARATPEQAPVDEAPGEHAPTVTDEPPSRAGDPPANDEPAPA